MLLDFLLNPAVAGDPVADANIATWHRITAIIEEPLRNWVPILEPEQGNVPVGEPDDRLPVYLPPTSPAAPVTDPMPTDTLGELLTAGDTSKHHLFPQQFRWYFEQYKGINIHEYTVEMGNAQHQAIHRAGFNNEWQRIIYEDMMSGFTLTTQQVLDIGLKRMKYKYGIVGPTESFW